MLSRSVRTWISKSAFRLEAARGVDMRAPETRQFPVLLASALEAKQGETGSEGRSPPGPSPESGTWSKFSDSLGTAALQGSQRDLPMTTRREVRAQTQPGILHTLPSVLRLPLARHSTREASILCPFCLAREMGRTRQSHHHISPSTSQVPARVEKGPHPHRQPRAPSPGPQKEQGGLSAAPGRAMPAT